MERRKSNIPGQSCELYSLFKIEIYQFLCEDKLEMKIILVHDKFNPHQMLSPEA